jgi:LPS export ABC transporter protein LptC
MISGLSRGSLIERKSLRVAYAATTIVLFLFFGLTSCGSKETAKPVSYEGPLQVAENILITHTEKDRVKTILKAKKVLDYQNGDEEFPEGIYIEFYNEFGKMTSSLKADNAYHFKEERKWRGRGNVEIKNLEKEQQLNTEELFWKPDTRKIFTDKFVTVTDEKDVIYGTGLDAVEDMSLYTIKKISGIFAVKE